MFMNSKLMVESVPLDKRLLSGVFIKQISNNYFKL